MLLTKAEVMKAVNKKYVEKIMLQKPNLVSDGGGGAKPVSKEKFIDIETVWAELRKPNLQIVEGQGTILSVLIREIAIRYRTDVKKGWRVKHGAKFFSVEHEPYHYGTQTTILVCKEVVK